MSQSQADDERPEDSSLENNTVSQTSHILFGCMMKEPLTPLNLEVESDYEVGKGPPKLDVLIIRRTGARWSKTQLEFLPDGIRQSNCKHVILELKYTESINKTAIFQTIGYLGSYLRLKQFKPENVCAFIVSSKSPQKKMLNQIGFEQTDIKGIYRSRDCLLSNIQLISLNDLSDAPYNLWIKLFSSKINQRLSVLKRILAFDLKKLNKGLVSILVKILNFWNIIGEISMQRIQKDILYESGGISDEVAGWFLSLFKPEDRLRGLKPEDRLHGLKPEDRLNGLDLKIIEDYLQKQRKMKR
ncbi:hypothetical protein MHK_003577 [Candidatus Magnetomorum sp. HK-1]|nr:hypothetical protein MHK_003577 [Candidatus Magnetomorum sp. HK-1]